MVLRDYTIFCVIPLKPRYRQIASKILKIRRCMNNINRMTAVLFAVIIGTLPFSCSDDGDDNVSADNLVKILMKEKWAYRDVSYHEGYGSHAWSYDVTETLYFTSENSGIAYILTKESDSELGNSRYTDWYMFSYYVNGNTVVITDESYNVTEYTYQRGGLSNGTALYLPSSLTNGDYEILEKIGPKTGTCGA